jgi:hypothetical protein
MTKREPDFDIDLPIGAKAEEWVKELFSNETAHIEVKWDEPALRLGHVYVEYECMGRDGKWYPSGIKVSKSGFYTFKFGDLPGALVIETAWLKRAARRAYHRLDARKECIRGSNPTKGVTVTLRDLWNTRAGNNGVSS